MQIKTIFGLAALAGITAFAAPASAQVGLDWIKLYGVLPGTPGISDGSEEFWQASCSDDAGNVIVAGYTGIDAAATNIDIVVRKYDPAGNVVWTYQKDVGGLSLWEFARGVACDKDGNVYVGGETFLNAANTDSNSFMNKINGATGAEIWQTIVVNAPSGTTDEGFYDVCVARDGSAVYGCGDWGTATAGNYAQQITKFNSGGAVAWTWTFDGPGSPTGYDQFRKVRLAPNGDVIAMGITRQVSTGSDIRVTRLTPAMGVVYNSTYDNNAVFVNGTDTAFDLAIDSTGAAAVAGRSADNASVASALALKFSPTGALAWSNRFNPNNTFTAEGVNIAVDWANNVYISGGAPPVGGTTTGSWFSFVRKLNGATGAQIWRSADFDGNGVAGVAGTFDSTRGLYAENNNQVICSHQWTGTAFGTSGLANINSTVQAYNSATGALVYSQLVDTAANTSYDDLSSVGNYTVLGSTVLCGLHAVEFTNGISQDLDGIAAKVSPTLATYIDLAGTGFVGPGSVIGGFVGNIRASDNSYFKLQVNPASEDTGDPIQFSWETTSPVANPSIMKLIVEASPEIDGCAVNLYLYNWGTFQFEKVQSGVIPQQVDTSVSWSPTGSLSRFVRTGDRRVRAQFGIEAVASEVDVPYKTDIDQAVVQIRP